MIVFQGVSRKFSGQATGARRSNFEIDPGEFVSLAGRSAAGNLLLLNFDRRGQANEGPHIFGQYEVISFAIMNPAFRRHIGVVFQDFRLLQRRMPMKTCFALEVSGDPAGDAELVPQVLDMWALGTK